MKQYNRIMLGEHGMYIADCLDNNYIGAGFLRDYDLSESPYNDEIQWRQKLVEKYLQINPDKSAGTARNSIGFLWTICFGLKNGDIVLASNGNSGYQVGEIYLIDVLLNGRRLSFQESLCPRSCKTLQVLLVLVAISQNMQMNWKHLSMVVFRQSNPLQ